MRRLAVALVHHPVLDREGAIVTSAVTNLDIHDISRTARTYGLTDYFIVHPIAAQRALVQRIVDHWRDGSSASRIPDRREALGVVRTVGSADEAFELLGGRAGLEVWATTARDAPGALTLEAARTSLGASGGPILLVLGTSWGLAPGLIDACDHLLEPVRGAGDGFNHLSVRSACAILLDRLTR